MANFVSKKSIPTIAAFTIICGFLFSSVQPAYAESLSVQKFYSGNPQSNIEPVLITPADQERVHSKRPTFTWTAIEGATGYTIKMSKDPDFLGYIYTATVTTNSFTPNYDLPINSTLYWHVRPIGVKPSVYSSTFSFKTASPTIKPDMVSPADNSLVDSLTPALNWDGVQDAVSYDIQIAPDDNFNTAIISVDAVTSIYIVPQPLATNKTWYWHVRAVNAEGDTSLWSTARTFRTKMDSPELISPTSGEQVHTTRPTFSWKTVAGATNYILETSYDRDFTETTRTFSIIGNSFTPLEDLARDATVYWKVIANGSNPSESDASNFQSANPPSVPVIISPTGSAIMRTTTPRLAWSKVKRVATYEIQIATDAMFTKNASIIQTKSDLNGYTFNESQNLASNPIWYWRVRSATADGDTSLWSRSSMFRINGVH
jgi:hypothetical protein